MGHIAHLGKQTSLSKARWSKFPSISPSIKREALHLNSLSPFIQGYFVPSLVEIDAVVLQKNVLMSALHFLSFVIISSWKSIPFTQGCFVPSLVEIFPMVLEKKVEKFTIEKC